MSDATILASISRSRAGARRRVMRWFLILVVGVSFAVSTMVWVSPVEATLSGEEGLIAFVSDRDGNHEIYVMEPDGSNQRNLTNHPASDSSPSWSPNGRQLAFVSNRTGVATIWLMGVDGSDLRELIPGTQPAWSPDGSQIAFVENRDFDRVPVASIWVVNVDGTGLTRVTSPEMDPIYLEELQSGRWVYLDIWDSGPDWFPDGESLLFHRYRAPHITYDMMELDLSSGTVEALPIDRRSRGGADIAPDGNRVLFNVLAGMQGQTGLVMYSLATDEYGQTGGIGSRWISGFSWSPQGTRFAIGLNPGGTNNYVAIVNPDGPVSVIADSPDAHDSGPVWQPVNPYPVGLVDPTQGEWHLRHPDGHVESFFYGNPGDVPFMGDWDCDGVDTPGLYRQSDGYVYLRDSNSQGIADRSFFFGNPGDVPLSGDFNGDGCDTVSIYRPSEQRFYIINHLGTKDEGLGQADIDYVFGNPGDSPFVGDFNGDGIDTAGLHRGSTGLVYYRNTHSQGAADNQFLFGDPADRFITNDWNSNGSDSASVFRPSNRTHYFRFTNTQGTADAQYIWGDPDWLPVTGTFSHK